MPKYPEPDKPRDLNPAKPIKDGGDARHGPPSADPEPRSPRTLNPNRSKAEQERDRTKGQAPAAVTGAPSSDAASTADPAHAPSVASQSPEEGRLRQNPGQLPGEDLDAQASTDASTVKPGNAAASAKRKGHGA